MRVAFAAALSLSPDDMRGEKLSEHELHNLAFHYKTVYLQWRCCPYTDGDEALNDYQKALIPLCRSVPALRVKTLYRKSDTQTKTMSLDVNIRKARVIRNLIESAYHSSFTNEYKTSTSTILIPTPSKTGKSLANKSSYLRGNKSNNLENEIFVFATDGNHLFGASHLLKLDSGVSACALALQRPSRSGRGFASSQRKRGAKGQGEPLPGY
jgi:hypothetical protein